MPSASGHRFTENAADIDRLMEIHRNLGGTGQGRRFQLEVLNKSAVILVTAFWEAYCEDVASEALEHLIQRLTSATNLPVELKKVIAKHVKAEPNEIYVWGLADSGWKTIVRSRLAQLTAQRNMKLNTPKTAQIDELFFETLGLKNISNSWIWKASTADRAKKKLDRYVKLRGEVAHRGAAPESCTRDIVIDYFGHVKNLVLKTDDTINKYVHASTGVGLF